MSSSLLPKVLYSDALATPACSIHAVDAYGVDAFFIEKLTRGGQQAIARGNPFGYGCLVHVLTILDRSV